MLSYANPFPRPDADTVCSWGGYLYFVHERESIRLKRESGVDAPWTEDPILDKYKFTNIRRRDDRLSKWVDDHLLASYHMHADLWFTLLIARLINWPPTLQALLDNCVIPCKPEEFNAAQFVAVLEDCKAEGAKVYGGSYMVYPTMKDPGGVKSEALAKHIIGSAIEHADAVRNCLWDGSLPSIEKFVDELSKCFGISTFMAGQVANDLTWVHSQLGKAVDLYKWAPRGPGSQKGLNYLFHKPLTYMWDSDEFCVALRQANHLIQEELSILDLDLHSVQSTFCEYSKYTRTVMGHGKPKSLYKPETAY